MVMGLLSPTLSTKGGEGEPLARCSRPPDACKRETSTPPVLDTGCNVIFKIIVVPRQRPIAASIWLAMPKSGHSELTPPSGSRTPRSEEHTSELQSLRH